MSIKEGRIESELCETRSRTEEPRRARPKGERRYVTLSKKERRPWVAEYTQKHMRTGE